jgi:long-chain acyl-CoA synthetase
MYLKIYFSYVKKYFMTPSYMIKRTNNIIKYRSRNLTELLNDALLKNPEKKILGEKVNGTWNWITCHQLVAKTNACYDTISHNMLNIGDRIVYKGKNSIDWVAWNIATNSWGCTWVPLYRNQTQQYSQYIVDNCKPSLFITDDIENTNVKNTRIISNEVIVEKHNYYEPLNIEPLINIANIIYTSGTTGNPRGVILTHENIISNIESINTRFQNFENNNFTSLNILPWAHIYGLTAELYYNLLNNNKVAISTSPDNFIRELREIQPGILYVVPRVLQMIKNKIQIFDNPLTRLAIPKILDFILGNITAIFVGGAALDKDTKDFFERYGIVICEGYGCTETSPMISVNHTTSPRDMESIGKIMDNLHVIIENNEILVSGPSIMKGYWNDMETTNKVLVERNGKIYYKTGDSGIIKNDFLYYKGRINDNYKLNNGKFVELKTIEVEIEKYFNEKFAIYGENREHNVVITESPHKISGSILKSINQHIDNHIKIKGNIVVPEGTFEMFYTPKLSLKRNPFFKHISNLLDNHYK